MMINLGRVIVLGLFFSLSASADVKYSVDDGYNNANFRTNGELLFLQTHLKANSVVVDVGANIGDWSKMVVAIDPFSKIYAFEPHPEVFQILERERTPQMECFNFALSDSIKDVELFAWGGGEKLNRSRLNGLYYRPILESFFKIECAQVMVKTLTLDVFCAEKNIEHIDLLKIDTEGSEWDVLKGAKNMLAVNAIQSIQFEYGGAYIDSKTTLKDVFFLLNQFGYRIYRITPKSLKEIECWTEDLENYQYCNYVAVVG
jgi:FkbM family methyltransferase